MTKDLKNLIRIVKNASRLINKNVQVKAKGNDGDLVTNFDYEIEKYIIQKLKRLYPNFSIVSEEFNSEQTLAQNCFTIDPIDATINFANGIPLWGIQVACVRDGETCAAVIYLKDIKELYYADETGAYLNGKKIHVSNTSSKSSVYVIEAGFRPPAIQRMILNAQCSNFRNFGAACVDYAWTACGRLSGTIFRKDSAWDYVPGMYLVKQAGGFVSDESNSHIAANSEEFLNILKTEGKVAKSDK